MFDFALLAHSLGLRPVVLQVGFAGMGHGFIEGRQSIDSFNQVDGEELVIDGGVSRLVAFQVGEIAGIGVCVWGRILVEIYLLRFINVEKTTTVSPMQRRPALEFTLYHICPFLPSAHTADAEDGRRASQQTYKYNG